MSPSLRASWRMYLPVAKPKVDRSPLAVMNVSCDVLGFHQPMRFCSEIARSKKCRQMLYQMPPVLHTKNIKILLEYIRFQGA